ncbi:MAG: hypothetical protein M1817_002807 [Caeruleum heppii]|nr:MAG: hypothetical protein M1817_002807 [Caeruleum heppii]
MAGRPNTNVPPFTRRASAGTILDLPETLQLEIFAWIPPADFTAFIASRAQFGMLYHTHWRSIYHNMLRDRYNVLADLYPFQGFNPVSAGVAPQHGVDIGYHDQLENHYIQQDHPDRFPWRSPTLTPRLPAISAEQTNLHAYVTYLDFRHQHMDCFVHDIFYKQLGLTDVSYSSLYLNMARLWRYKSPHYPGYEQVAFLKKFALAERKDLAQFLSSLAYALLRDWSDEEIMFRYGHFLTPLTTNSYPLQAQMVPALSRLKGAIDSRIAEEQARAKGVSAIPSRSSSSARATPRTASPATRPSRPREREKVDQDVPTKGPDPSTFEPEFVIDDDELSSRGGTPRPEKQKEMAEAKPSAEMEDERSRVTDPERPTATEIFTSSPGTAELPTDVKVKLRKLDRLEGRYQELLRSYRIAHARVLSIEPFETSLRENTPLTSINDPPALIEYLNQLNLRGDMVMGELKRVTSDRDDLKQKLDEAEKGTRAAWDEVAKLRKDKDDVTGPRTPVSEDNTTLHTADKATKESSGGTSPNDHAPSHPPRSPNLSILGKTLFSPKAKIESPAATEESEEFFSYDSEVPRLQNELKDRDSTVHDLQTEVKTLRGDLHVARESTEGMVQSLETATRDLNALRESKERDESELQERQAAFAKEIVELKSKLQQAESDLAARMHDRESASAKAEDSLLQKQLDEQKVESEQLSLAKTKEEQRVAALVTTVDQLREQLEASDAAKASLAQVLKLKTQEREDLEQRLQALSLKRTGLGSHDIEQAAPQLGQEEIPNVASPSLPTNGSAVNTGAAKKRKNKKKKKKGADPNTDVNAEGVDGEEDAPSVAQLEKAVDSRGEVVEESASSKEELHATIRKLQATIDEKTALVETLNGTISGETDLREEIEGLRDDLIHVGDEHVQAKEKIKALESEKMGLEKEVEALQGDDNELRLSQKAGSADSERAHQTLSKDFDDLKTKASVLQTDLAAAQQLATTRFKELTDLRGILQEAQPELGKLRTEVTSLRTAREELHGANGKLKRLEDQEQDLRSEVKNLRQQTSEQGQEIRVLIEKAKQETNNRVMAEEGSNSAQRDVRRLESEKKDLLESSKRVSKDLAKAQEDAKAYRTKIRDLEQQVTKLGRETEALREEMELKTAQHASAESLMSSMRAQTAEMSMQMKEARERCESLEEELGDAHRLLSERSREGDTMRRLLADAESRADSKIRDMRERMELAVEERDRAEEEASTSGRRRARELEELKDKARELERNLRRAEEEKDELGQAEQDWRKRREDLDSRATQSAQEVTEVRHAMGELRDTLDESERQSRELERQKGELRRTLDEAQGRLDKLQKTNKVEFIYDSPLPSCGTLHNLRADSLTIVQIMADELKSVRHLKSRTMSPEGPSSRSSLDSSPSRAARGMSPSGAVNSKVRNTALAHTDGSSSTNNSAAPPMDYVYLKNVLLQFLEQRDKKHQAQLIPVLGMLLHFDK